MGEPPMSKSNVRKSHDAMLGVRAARMCMGSADWARSCHIGRRCFVFARLRFAVVRRPVLVGNRILFRLGGLDGRARAAIFGSDVLADGVEHGVPESALVGPPTEADVDH